MKCTQTVKQGLSKPLSVRLRPKMTEQAHGSTHGTSLRQVVEEDVFTTAVGFTPALIRRPGPKQCTKVGCSSGSSHGGRTGAISRSISQLWAEASLLLCVEGMRQSSQIYSTATYLGGMV